MNFTPGIIMDILAAVVLLFSMFRGAQKGFAKTLASFMQWFVCIIAGFFLCSSVKDYIVRQTGLDEAINNYILDQVSTTIEESAPYKAMPQLFHTWIEGETSGFVYGTSASLTDIILTVFSFIAVIFVIKLICSFFALIFSKEYHDGLIGFLDGFVGFLFGIIRGILLVFLAFAVLVPIVSLMPPDASLLIRTAMDQSYAASFLYDDNLILILVRDLFS